MTLPYISYLPHTEDEELPLGTHILLLTPEVIAFLNQSQRDAQQITSDPHIRRIHFDFPDIHVNGQQITPLLRLPEDIEAEEVIGDLDQLLAIAETDHHSIVSINRHGAFIFRAELSYCVEYSPEASFDGSNIEFS